MKPWSIERTEHVRLVDRGFSSFGESSVTEWAHTVAAASFDGASDVGADHALLLPGCARGTAVYQRQRPQCARRQIMDTMM
ncbi:hypothetical protein [Streptomyces sp. NPDC005731]|uniref:hypothetical protein n=1 Tax=unclassified Streptomyces TaxID=2593676 RepID=UPI00340E7754